MKQRIRFTMLAMVLTLGILGIAHNVHAVSGWQNTYTNYFGVSASCSLCHTSAPALNATGTTFLNAGGNTIAGWTAIKPADPTPPTVTITNPATTPYAATSTPLSIVGTASDNFTGPFGVTQISWSNSLGGSGTATGTTSWSGSIPLVSGSNVITVTARDQAGNTTAATRTVTYAVAVVAPVISSFTATPASINSGQSSTLAWTLSGGAPTTLSIDNSVGSVLNSSSRGVSPTATTTYTLTASNGAGSVTRSVTVTVAAALTAPVIGSFTATPASITSGQSSTLAWTLSGGAPTTLSINSSVGSVLNSTSRSVSPAATTTYTLTASNSAGSVTRTVTVIVTPAVVAPLIGSFTATPASITSGQSSTLAWALSGGAPTTLSINSTVGSVLGSSSRAVSPTATTTYTLTATNSAGTVSQNVTVTVTPTVVAPVIGSFTVTPASITSGQSSTLAWTLSGGAPTTLSINNSVGSVLNTSSRAVSPTATTTYTLTATNSAGSVTRSATVTVNVAGALPVIGSFTATPASVTPGQSSTLAWTLSGGSPTTLTISNGVGTVTGTSRVVSPTVTTTYTLSASNSAGSATRSVNVTVTAVTPPPSSGDLPSFSHPTQITNPYFPVANLRQQTFEGTVGGHAVRVVRTLQRRTQSFKVGNQDVRTLVRQERSYVDGALDEIALDYFGQADDGSVYLFGEEVNTYSRGRVVSHEGSWRYGVDTKQLSVIMPTQPTVGIVSQAENLEVLSVSETVTVPAGRFRNCLKIQETLSDGSMEYKYYAPNVGVIKEVTEDGEINLVSLGNRGEKEEREESEED
jgi:hypothetical protein